MWLQTIAGLPTEPRKRAYIGHTFWCKLCKFTLLVPMFTQTTHTVQFGGRLDLMPASISPDAIYISGEGGWSHCSVLWA